MSATFKAFVVDKKEAGFTTGFKEITRTDLPLGEVLVKVAYSSVNYKDGLASIPEGKIVRDYPFVPGIDLAGVVVESSEDSFQPGDEVIVTSYALGVSHYGGFSEYARVKAEWVVPLPSGLTLKEAMALGTAGFTAALSVHKLEHNGLTPRHGTGVGHWRKRRTGQHCYQYPQKSGLHCGSEYRPGVGTCLSQSTGRG